MSTIPDLSSLRGGLDSSLVPDHVHNMGHLLIQRFIFHPMPQLSFTAVLKSFKKRHYRRNETRTCKREEHMRRHTEEKD